MSWVVLAKKKKKRREKRTLEAKLAIAGIDIYSYVRSYIASYNQIGSIKPVEFGMGIRCTFFKGGYFFGGIAIGNKAY